MSEKNPCSRCGSTKNVSLFGITGYALCNSCKEAAIRRAAEDKL